jgi:hypothetical protein
MAYVLGCFLSAAKVNAKSALRRSFTCSGALYTPDYISNKGDRENVDARVGEDASDENIPPVVPYSRVFRICTQEL